jgi:hypothetical protein
VQFLIVLAILTLVVLVVSAPLRRAQGPAAADAEAAPPAVAVEELEAAREAKYREIRDADLDHRTGKLSDEDYEALDRALRGEAVKILRALDDARSGYHPVPR